MMKNKFFKVFILILLVFCLSIAFFGCDQSGNSPKDKVVKSISIKTKPQQYYLINDAIDLSGGEILVTYKDNSTETIAFTDSRLKVEHSGTGVGDVTNIMRIKYGDKSATLPYTVGKTRKVESVTVDGKPQQKYSLKGDIVLKGVKIIVKYVGVAKADEIWLTSGNSGKYSETYLNNKQITLVGFNTEKVGNYVFIIKYLASEFYFSYEVVKESWISDIDVTDQSQIRVDYFEGDTLNLNDAKLAVIKSDGTQKRISITPQMVTGFSTDTSGTFTMHIGYSEFKSKKIPIEYTVRKSDDIASVVVEILNFEANINVGEKAVFNKSNLVVNLNGGGHFKIPLLSEGVSLTHKGQPIDTMSTALGGNYVIDVEYKGYTTSFTLTVLKGVVKVKIIDSHLIKTNYAEGESFDFGGAKMHFTYDDGTKTEVIIQEQYDLPIKNRVVSFKNNKAVDVESFDMSKGEHSKEFYIVVTLGEENFDDIGRFYINYTVS